MKNASIKVCAALLVTAAMMGNEHTLAEELRLGDYIYMPSAGAAQVQGTISLQVNSLLLDENGVQQWGEPLAGAEFGVYVVSGNGELKPWANPLYPTEQMRIRTGEGETRFTLPQGVEVYLRQESAPQGFDFDHTVLIPVNGTEIVVVNAQDGQLMLEAVDSAGKPIEGVSYLICDQEGNKRTVTTDADGKALFVGTGMFTVEEQEVPSGAIAADRVQLDGNEAAMPLTVTTESAKRTTASFVHAVAGSVDLKIGLVSWNAQGDTMSEPLPQVKLEVIGVSGAEVLTDENGEASLSLMEGVYDVRITYEGKQNVLMPLEYAQVVVSNGKATEIGFNATKGTGDIQFSLDSSRMISDASVTLRRTETGDAYGPYPFDADGIAQAGDLPAGEYAVTALKLPEQMILQSVCADSRKAQEAEGFTVGVTPGDTSTVDFTLLSREKQSYSLGLAVIDDAGMTVEQTIAGKLDMELVDQDGKTVAEVSAYDGELMIDELSGAYRLRLSEQDAAALDVETMTEPFTLPSDENRIALCAKTTRVIITCADEDGALLPGAEYVVTDQNGMRFAVEPDEIAEGETITPPVSIGELTIEMISAPEHHTLGNIVRVYAEANKAAQAQCVARSHGTIDVFAGMQSLDENGKKHVQPLPGAAIEVSRVLEGAFEPIGITLYSDDNGMASVQLEQGSYLLTLHGNENRDYAVIAEAADTLSTACELLAADPLGGIGVEIVGEELSPDVLAQARFALTYPNGTTADLALADGMFYIGDLPEGEYLLSQKQMAEGFALGADRTVRVTGGEVARVQFALEEYAQLSVNKTGLTFNKQLQSFVVPLSGEFGVYIEENGEMKPYPSADRQATVWANVMENDDGRETSVRLPANVEGTTYYIRELNAASGFASDEEYHEVTLRAGENTTVGCTVSSDRGFFSVELVDAENHEYQTGSLFEVADEKSGETVLRFETTQRVYQNDMALPVGNYVLRQLEAAPGYALCVQPEQRFEIKPYLTQGGYVTGIMLSSARIPDGADMAMDSEIFADRQQGLTLIESAWGRIPSGEVLARPQLEMHISAQERTTITSAVLSGAGDEADSSIAARLEYCLSGGGWQPSDARIIENAAAPSAVSLDDVRDDIIAVRVIYYDAKTGLEQVGSGFTPGTLTVNVRVDGDGEKAVNAQASFGGNFVYRTQFVGDKSILSRQCVYAKNLTLAGDGAFGAVPAGMDGRVSGVVFFDDNADGILSPGETSRYAGMAVSLISQSGDVVSTCRTGNDGSYAFDAISGGVYTVQFDGGNSLVFSANDDYSDLATSSVADTRYGESAALTFDGDHSDYVVNAGCVYAASVRGVVREKQEDGSITGFEGIHVEISARNGLGDEPVVVSTQEDGSFQTSGLIPGKYVVSVRLPDGYVLRESEHTLLMETDELEQGEEYDCGVFTAQPGAGISGSVRVDDDADGLIAADAQPLEGVNVTLLAVQDQQTSQIAATKTDAKGNYSFDGLLDGTYSVLFNLHGDWAFTRFGEDSSVYGAVSQSGSTQNFDLKPGERVTELNAGVTIPAGMTVTVFRDMQPDGLMNGADAGLPGVRIGLIRIENGEETDKVEMQTDGLGEAQFTNVTPGEYVIAYEMPDLWRTTKRALSNNYGLPETCVSPNPLAEGRSEVFSLGMGQDDRRMYIGAVLSGSISGMVYDDDNADAKYGDGEKLRAGVRAELINNAGEVTARTVSDESGHYAFEGLTPGRYRVRFIADDGCAFSGTERSMGRGGVQPSDTHESSTRALTVSAGMELSTVDAGIVRLSSVSGLVWEDRNADGVMDDGESLLPGVTVHLLSGTGRAVAGTAETQADGSFSFKRVKPGTYTIRVTPPQGYDVSGALAGSPLSIEKQRDGKGYSQSFTLLGGAQVEGVGCGLLTLGTVGGTVWQDANYNGVQDSGENGLRSATVVLIGADGSEIARMQTSGNGDFRFMDLMPGNYSLEMTLPEGYVYTAAGQGSAAMRSDDPQTMIELGELKMGETMDAVKVGALRNASIGGVVWMDADSDGRRQNADTGVADVRVQMEVVRGTDAGLILETKTDAAGAYRFEGVMPGAVRLTFGLPDGMAYTRNVTTGKRVSAVPGVDDTVSSTQDIEVKSGVDQMEIDVGAVGVGTLSGRVWLDSNYNGKNDADETGVANVTLSLVDPMSGAQKTSTLSDENGDFAISFVREGQYRLEANLPDGMIFTENGESAVPMTDSAAGATDTIQIAMGESRSNIRIGAIHPAVVSGSVIVDSNENGVCDADEAGLVGVTVSAVQGGTVVETTSTNANGMFTLKMLRPGNYRLRYALPENALFAREVGLTLANENAQEGESAQLTLSMGQQTEATPVPTVIVAEIAGTAWTDTNVNGSMDADEERLEGVEAELLDANGAVAAKTTTDSEGRYAFRALRGGTYSIRFTLPGGMLFADQTDDPNGSSVPVAPGDVGETDSLFVMQGDHMNRVNVGAILPGQIGDTVWLDMNGNGLQDYEEPLLPDVELELIRVNADGAEEKIAETTSDEYGYYRFAELRPGRYRLRVALNSGDVLTACVGAPMGEIDSDVDPQTGMTDVLLLPSGKRLRNIDIGFTAHEE